MALTDEILPSIKPGDDFFGYVNGRWLDANPIPADKARVGAFEMLTDQNIERLKALLEAPNSPDDAPGITLVRKYYRQAMDEAALEQGTTGVVRAMTERVQAITSTQELVDFVAAQHAQGLGVLWDSSIEPDDKNSRRYLVRFHQGGLGLPDRDFYLEDNERFTTIRSRYREFLTALFELVGQDAASERAGRTIELETALAQASMSATERRDPDKTYNLYEPAAMSKTYPGIDWPKFLTTLQLDGQREVNVSQPGFLSAVLELIANTPIETWHDYLVAHSILPLMTKLDAKFEELHFSFYGKVLRGTTELEPRYKRIIRTCMMMLPEPTGQLFVQSYFDESAKQAIYDLVDHLKTAFQARLEHLEWMSKATKAKALEKLETFLPLLGYPDTWKSYDGLALDDTYAGSTVAINAYEWQRVVRRIDEPVDRREWLMSPVLVNAYYWPSTNGITFPAGILQPPFFDASGDFAANYGAIGAVIGHEITHGFDDEGSKFDAEGNLKSWWSEADRTAFDARSKRLVEQYNAYEVHGRHVNGQLTLGENIADLGGIHMAYDGLQTKLAELGRRDDVDEFTPEQRFFMGYARSWRENIRPEFSLQLLVSDPHSPDRFRTNGIVRNCDAFYDAFGVTPDDELYLAPDERVRIW